MTARQTGWRETFAGISVGVYQYDGQECGSVRYRVCDERGLVVTDPVDVLAGALQAASGDTWHEMAIAVLDALRDDGWDVSEVTASGDDWRSVLVW